MEPMDSTESNASTEQSTTSTDNQATESDNEVKNSTEQTEEGAEQASGESEEESAFSKVNPDELPKELQQAYKSMQADYTRKTQEIREIKEKAKLYDQWQQEQIIKSKFPQPVKQATPETEDYLAQSLGVDINDLTPEEKQQFDTLSKLIDSAVTKRITEHVKPIQNKMMHKEYEQELAEVRKAHSDFDTYLPLIESKLKSNPQLTYEDAYKLASYDDREKKGRSEALKNLEVKKKQAIPKVAQAKESEEPASNFESIFGWAKKRVSS